MGRGRKGGLLLTQGKFHTNVLLHSLSIISFAKSVLATSKVYSH